MTAGYPELERLGAGQVLLRGSALAIVDLLVSEARAARRDLPDALVVGLLEPLHEEANVARAARRAASLLPSTGEPLEVPEDRLMTAGELAVLVRRSVRTVTREAGRFGGWQSGPGGTWWFDRDVVMAELARAS